MATPVKRIPTVWLLLSRTSSRSLLPRSTLPEADSSPSSRPARTGTSRVCTVGTVVLVVEDVVVVVLVDVVVVLVLEVVVIVAVDVVVVVLASQACAEDRSSCP